MRSRPSDWHIRPHAHDELSHVFLVRAGGAMHADMNRFHFRAPAVLTVPCRCIHAFEFETDTSGFVATIGEAHLRRIVRQTPGLERWFDAPGVKTIEDDAALARDLSAVDDELSWNSAFSDAALEARLSVFLIETARALGAQGEGRGIAQIDFSLGYQDPAYFSRVFGRHVGLSPQAYRRRIARQRVRLDSSHGGLQCRLAGRLVYP